MCARLLKPRGHGVKQNWVERTGGRVEKRVLSVYGGFAVVVFAAPLDFRADLGRLHGRHGVAVHGCSQSFSAHRRQQLRLGRMIGKEGSSPQQMRQLQDQASTRCAPGSDDRPTFTLTGEQQFLASNQGSLLHSSIRRKNARPIQQVSAGMMGKLNSIPGCFCVLAARFRFWRSVPESPARIKDSMLTRCPARIPASL